MEGGPERRGEGHSLSPPAKAPESGQEKLEMEKGGVEEGKQTVGTTVNWNDGGWPVSPRTRASAK